MVFVFYFVICLQLVVLNIIHTFISGFYVIPAFNFLTTRLILFYYNRRNTCFFNKLIKIRKVMFHDIF